MRVHVIKAMGLGALTLLIAYAPSPAYAIEKPPATWDPASRSNYHRGRSAKISMVVIHTVEGSYRSGINTFTNPSSRVSAHYVVGDSGQIVQMVADKDTAYHVKRANPRAIGIEHAGFMSRRDTWTDAKYRSSAKLTRWLCDTYKIPIDRKHIVGHREVPGNDHGDPGRYFDWDYYMRLVRGADDGTSGPTPGTGGTGAGSGTGTPTKGITGAIAGKDDDTPDRPDPKHPQLSMKSRGDHVEELQKILNQEGYDIEQDGIFGPETEKAVRAFQRSHGLEADGIVGPKTWRQLDKVNAAARAPATTPLATRTSRGPPDGPLGDP